MDGLTSSNGNKRGLEEPFIDIKIPQHARASSWHSKAEKYGIAPRYHKTENPLWQGIMNWIGSLYITCCCLLTIDTIMSCFLATVYTLSFYYYGEQHAINLNWTVVSTGIIFPTTFAIGWSFRRRDEALRRFAQLLGFSMSLWSAVHIWTVKGPAGEWAVLADLLVTEATPDGRQELGALWDEFLASLVAYFSTARWRRARHTVACLGGREECELMAIAHEQRLCVDSCLTRMRKVVQHLKTRGLAGGEAHRLDQYVTLATVAMEQLACLKEYRTPQLFRAMVRIYIQVMGALYAPYYVYLARGDSGEERNIGYAVAFAISVQLVISGLYSVMLGLEDPFAPHLPSSWALDCVDVPQLVEVNRRLLLKAQREAGAEWRTQPQGKEAWGVSTSPLVTPPGQS